MDGETSSILGDFATLSNGLSGKGRVSPAVEEAGTLIEAVSPPVDPPGFSTLDLGTPQKRHRRLELPVTPATNGSSVQPPASC